MRVLKDLEKFKKERKEMNEKLVMLDNKQINKFMSIDAGAYRAGALDVKTKELLGLVTSTVLRCEDCITYHIIRSVQEGWSNDEITDALNVALVVGGSITIPEIRRAVNTLYILREKEQNGENLADLI